MPQYRLRNTFTRPDTSVEWPFKRADLEGTPWRNAEDSWFTWFHANRTETVDAVWESETEVHVDILFEDQATFREYLSQMEAAAVGGQFETESWDNIENTDGFTRTQSIGYV